MRLVTLLICCSAALAVKLRTSQSGFVRRESTPYIPRLGFLMSNNELLATITIALVLAVVCLCVKYHLATGLKQRLLTKEGTVTVLIKQPRSSKPAKLQMY